MKTLHYKTKINAPKEKVWDAMLEPETYKIWTEPFGEGSYYEGSWDKGSRIKFLSPGGDGMFSEIADNRKYEFVSIKHLGIFKNGVEDTDSAEAKEWTSVFENYTFTGKNGNIEVKVEMTNVPDNYQEMFDKMWPNALDKLKQICEKT